MVRDYSERKEISYLSSRSNGQAEANRIQGRVNGCRTWQYPLSKKSNLEIDTVKWEDLPTFTKEFGWLLSSSRDNFF